MMPAIAHFNLLFWLARPSHHQLLQSALKACQAVWAENTNITPLTKLKEENWDGKGKEVTGIWAIEGEISLLSDKNCLASDSTSVLISLCAVRIFTILCQILGLECQSGAQHLDAATHSPQGWDNWGWIFPWIFWIGRMMEVRRECWLKYSNLNYPSPIFFLQVISPTHSLFFRFPV